MRQANRHRWARRWAGLALAGALVPAGCERTPGGTGATDAAKRPSFEATSTTLEGDVLARVGERRIRRDEVAAVVRARRVSAREAVRLLVEEAILAEAALRSGALDAVATRQPITACLARALVRRFDDDARGKGPFTDAELEAAMKQGDAWVELERGESRTVVHALVKAGVPDGAALAEQLRAAIVAAPDPGAFLTAAQAFAKNAPKGAVVAESLPSFVDDGRVAQKGQGGTLDLDFVKGAFALEGPGSTSAVIATSFGFHVIRLVSISPPVHAPREKRVLLLAPEVVRARVGDTFRALVDSLRAAAKIELVATEQDLLAPRFDAKSSGSPGT